MEIVFDLLTAWGLFYGMWLIMGLFSWTTQTITGLIMRISIENDGAVSSIAPQA